MRLACAALLIAAGSCSAFAQGYTYEMRLIPDGMAGSPGGPTAGSTFPYVPNTLTTRIGFWLQARVAQTSGQNWGITRVSSAPGAVSFISITDPANGSSLTRGQINAAGTSFGRGTGYRNGGVNTGASGNHGGATPFPGTAGNENGTIDNGGSGFLARRIYGFDNYVGATRDDLDNDNDGDFDDDGDGIPENPWRVNGATTPAGTTTSGVPHPSDGSFSPWANLYRFVVDINWQLGLRVIVIDSAAFVNGAVQAAPTSPGGSSYAMEVAPGQAMTASFTIVVPTPAGAGLLGLGALALMRRRR